MAYRTFGHFSEREAEEIASLLNEQNIEFELALDPETRNRIKESMGNNIRHLHGATICNDQILIKADVGQLDRLDPAIQKKLNELRLFWKEPDFDLAPEEGAASASSPQAYINSQEASRNGAVGLVLIFTLVAAAIYCALDYLL